MKAYTQGEIDYFCGVYAVINACRQILKGKKYFSYNDGCLFYQHLMQYLIDAGKIGEVLHHGTDYDLILRLVEQGSAMLFRNSALRLAMSFLMLKPSKALMRRQKRLTGA